MKKDFAGLQVENLSESFGRDEQYEQKEVTVLAAIRPQRCQPHSP